MKNKPDRESALHLIQLLSYRIHLVMSQEAKKARLSVLGYRVLEALSATSIAPDLGELARLFKVSPPTMCDCIAALRCKGFTYPRADPKDGRRVFVVITQEGKRAHQALNLTTLSGVLDTLSTRELKEYAQLTRKILAGCC
jgi:DNA-binding MarR family transcriptional regulator